MLLTPLPLNSEQVRIKADVFIHGQVFVEAESLRHVAEVVLGALRVPHHIVPGDCYRPGVGGKHAGQHAKRRGLAGSIRANQSEDFARMHVKREPVDRAKLAELLAEIGNEDGRGRVHLCTAISP